MIKNVFYFTLKALFVLEILDFVLTFSFQYKNGLIRKIMLISKFKTSQPVFKGLSVVKNFVLTFSFQYKNGLIRKTMLMSKFMTSQPG